MQPLLLLTDGKDAMIIELRQRKKELDTLRQLIYRLEDEYKDLRHRYERVDRAWAMRTRLRVVKPTEKAENSLEKRMKKMSQDEIDELIRDLEKMVK